MSHKRKGEFSPHSPTRLPKERLAVTLSPTAKMNLLKKQQLIYEPMRILKEREMKQKLVRERDLQQRARIQLLLQKMSKNSYN